MTAPCIYLKTSRRFSEHIFHGTPEKWDPGLRGGTWVPRPLGGDLRWFPRVRP